MKLVSWNVNGLRSVLRKNFLSFVETERPDILCLQETRCPADVFEPLLFPEYQLFWNIAERKGYSGTAIFTKRRPVAVALGLGIADHDGEGRVLTAEFERFFLINVYTPNSRHDLSRLPYRQEWDRVFLGYLRGLETRKPVVFCGDLNVAHTPLDLTRPRQSIGAHGFTVEERGGFDAFVAAGFLDTFREFETAGGHYTWWSPMTGARERNVGWRIDYFLISAVLRPHLQSAFIRCGVTGSDHCPVGIELNL